MYHKENTATFLGLSKPVTNLMNTTEKRSLTLINKIPAFKSAIEKLTISSILDENEKSYILGCSILFLKHYGIDARLTSYAELAYYIILKYSIKYADYQPLYDFSTSFGFYPTVKAILDNNLIEQNQLNHCLLDIEVERFRNHNYIATLHQHHGKKNLLKDTSSEVSYIAPTSFGKSSVIVDCIVKHLNTQMKIVVVVPTKSLLMQTYRMIKNAGLNRKIIIHDEMYQEEDSFIAIFTQERSLRLLSKHAVKFDLLIIDEAHNLLKDDPRSILLSRLISKNKLLNSKQHIIYLSPLINDTNCLKVTSDQAINEHRVPFNIKEPEICEYRKDGIVYQYNRFVNEFYQTGKEKNIFSYIINNSKSKNFLYNFRPIKIEGLAKELSKFLPQAGTSSELEKFISELKREVHKDFFILDYIKHGVVYLHGKLPDLIKEYIESKFRDLPEIRYIIANSVILEGMNLPIDNLFILNTRKLYGKELTNLIGRVNRLNSIFTPDHNNLDKLLPPVHFVNSDEYNSGNNMANKISLLRSRIFKDEVDNPTLEEFDIDKLKGSKEQKEKKKSQIEQIISEEEFLTKEPNDDNEKLKQYLIETGISSFYSGIDTITDVLNKRIDNAMQREDWDSLNMMQKIFDLFLRDNDNITDYEFLRLRSPETQSYYDSHIRVNQKRSLKENIIHQFTYFKKRVADGNSIFYFGSAYGERAWDPTATPPQQENYIDLSIKEDAELINLAIVKLKMEDDFVSFKLNKFIIMMHDYKLIDDDEYNLYIYGTTDQAKINLTKIGLSVSLISRLEADNQLQHLYFDSSNNLKARDEFNIYKESANDFYRFEIERFL